MSDFSVHSHPVGSSTNCFDTFFADPRVKIAYAILEKISLIALAAIAAYTCPKLFLPFFAGGVVVGTAVYWNKRVTWPWEEQKKLCCDGKEQCDEGDQPAGCSGFTEQLSGVRLPPPLGLCVNFAITAGHIVGHHDMVIFVPVTALQAGVYVGAMLGDALPRLFDYMTTEEESTSHTHEHETENTASTPAADPAVVTA